MKSEKFSNANILLCDYCCSLQRFHIPQAQFLLPSFWALSDAPILIDAFSLALKSSSFTYSNFPQHLFSTDVAEAIHNVLYLVASVERLWMSILST